jgi:hypothetical protein
VFLSALAGFRGTTVSLLMRIAGCSISAVFQPYLLLSYFTFDSTTRRFGLVHEESMVVNLLVFLVSIASEETCNYLQDCSGP